MHSASRGAGLPELTGVRKVWFSDWYDGPITGLASYGDREYWFVMVMNDADSGGDWDLDPRVYVLHRLTDEQLEDAWTMHRTFVAAGTPGCLHSPECPVDSAAGSEAVEAARDRWPSESEDSYLDAPAVGWFRDA